MKLFGVRLNLPFLFASKEDKDVTRKERFISSVIRTRAFSKLTLQDKVSSLCKLIAVFRKDCGFTPASLEKSLGVLNVKLRRETDKSFRTHYSDPVVQKVKKVVH